MVVIKRYGNIYSKICDIENLRHAHRKARRGKTWYKEVEMVDADPDKYLLKLQKQLLDKTYKTSDYEMFIKVDKGKEREIFKLPYYPDRICQWAIMLQIEDILMNSFIYDTYASLPGRGIHMALKRVNRVMKDKDATKYCLKFDIKKYFPSIDHNILKSLLRRKFKDPDLLWLLDEIIDSAVKGIPIGNYLSQYFANLYLSYFDYWMKEVNNCEHYFRYMDDVIILHSSKEFLHNLREEIECYLNDNLKLKLKENWQVFPTFTRGIDFVGYRSFGGYTLLRKSTAKNIKKKAKEIRNRETKDRDVNSIMSYKGWLKYCNSHNFEKKYVTPIIRRLIEDGRIQVSRC